MTRVLFVCLGNICRSPTAHGIFRQLLSDQVAKNNDKSGAAVDAGTPLFLSSGVPLTIELDSAGTAAWHEGKAPDSRSVAHAARRGIDLRDLRARQVQARDFLEFDYILAMDKDNLTHLQAMAPVDFRGHLGLMLDFVPNACCGVDVPDPYYDAESGFEQVLDLLDEACRGLLQSLIEHKETHKSDLKRLAKTSEDVKGTEYVNA